MRISVHPWAGRLRGALGPGLSRPILGAFALVLVVVTGMFALQLTRARQQHAAGESARGSEHVLRESYGLERRVIDLETGLRGYLLTGQDGFLRPYTEARDAIPGRLDALTAITRDPAQRERARRLRGLIESYRRTYAAPLRATGLAMTREITCGPTMSSESRRPLATPGRG